MMRSTHNVKSLNRTRKGIITTLTWIYREGIALTTETPGFNPLLLRRLALRGLLLAVLAREVA
jgi:hypothetical protein